MENARKTSDFEHQVYFLGTKNEIPEVQSILEVQELLLAQSLPAEMLNVIFTGSLI